MAVVIVLDSPAPTLSIPRVPVLSDAHPFLFTSRVEDHETVHSLIFLRLATLVRVHRSAFLIPEEFAPCSQNKPFGSSVSCCVISLETPRQQSIALPFHLSLDPLHTIRLQCNLQPPHRCLSCIPRINLFCVERTTPSAVAGACAW